MDEPQTIPTNHNRSASHRLTGNKSTKFKLKDQNIDSHNQEYQDLETIVLIYINLGIAMVKTPRSKCNSSADVELGMAI